MGKKTLLITGSSGHVGTHLTELLSPFYKIITLSKNDGACVKADINLLSKKQIQGIYDAFSIDTVIHCAGYTNPKTQKEVSFNVFAFTKFLTKKGMRHIVFGSVAEYGFQEDEISESSLEQPTSLYGFSKLSQERVAHYYFEEEDFNITYIRISNILMPYGRDGSLIESLFRASELSNNAISMSNNKVARDYIDIRDVANAVQKILSTPSPSFLYNICSGNQTTYRELLHDLRIIWQNIYTKPFPHIIFSGKRELFCSGRYTIQKAETELGWKPKHSLNESIRWLIKYRHE